MSKGESADNSKKHNILRDAAVIGAGILAAVALNPATTQGASSRRATSETVAASIADRGNPCKKFSSQLLRLLQCQLDNENQLTPNEPSHGTKWEQPGCPTGTFSAVDDTIVEEAPGGRKATFYVDVVDGKPVAKLIPASEIKQPPLNLTYGPGQAVEQLVPSHILSHISVIDGIPQTEVRIDGSRELIHAGANDPCALKGPGLAN